ncbi:glycosyltransferase family 8 protein [Eubacterium xylanophilum]|uniref:glycosyltransferase family 8 protein n=1 Tax=Eubacterium xylanophilum TaxID=39497 RepID=UPI00047BD234|nr:glycosyltransferase family 8 protein [Eubacterium xylanophilum]
MNQNVAHIVYASDDRFAEILGVSLVSLYENSKDMDDIIIYVLDSGVSEKNRRRIESISKQYNRTVPQWIKAQDISKVLEMEVAVDRGSLSQYARLFVSSDLPENLERVLYLDCDVVINKSIKELWNINLHGKTIAALLDAFSSQYRANIGLKKNDVMFNSGVMLINLKRWKELKVEEKLLEFIRSKNGVIQQGDQGALNAILSHDTYCFEPRFNSVTIYHDFNYDEMMIYRKPPKGFYGREEIKVAVDDPVIIHYTTSFLSKRPWIIGCQHRYVNAWLNYKSKSPWKTEPLWMDSVGKGERLVVNVVKVLPRGIMIRMAGIAQAYIRPFKNRIKRMTL